jgi:malate dehydrogenase (oxaloacetate-decarboxylating)(NADP+)
MEGKSVLFKRFADIDSVDIEVDTTDPDEFINAVKYLGPSWGGINLEDIDSPECFIIEEKLKELMDIPVFHDDQHGTAIICAAGIINAAEITGRKISDQKVVLNGAGAEGISCVNLIKMLGVPHENVICCDRSGVIYEGLKDGMNQWKYSLAVKTETLTLKEALVGADVFLGLSVAGAVTKDMVKGMAPQPIIFAMANPVPEILPEDAREACPDAIIATGRSDYPNQVNNVMGFPYIFRGALDVRATTINEEMKLAAAQALAKLAKEPVPDEVLSAYGGRKLEFGPEYIIPVPFDPRLISMVPAAVAKAAMESGVAQKPIEDLAAYKRELAARLNPTANTMNLLFDKVRSNPKNIIFSEGEEEKIIRAAAHWRDQGYGIPKLVGREDKVLAQMLALGVDPEGIEICNAANNQRVDEYAEFLYGRLQRKGYLKRDCIRLVKTDRNIFASCMLELGDGDAMLTGLTRGYYDSLKDVFHVIGSESGKLAFGLSIMLVKGRTVFIADTTVNELPTPEQLADIAIAAAKEARNLGHEPRVAMVSYSTFGSVRRKRSEDMKAVVDILDKRNVDFEYDGEMAADIALNEELLNLYPFSRLSAPANILIMPALHSAHIAYKLLQELGGVTSIGPMLVGLERPVQVLRSTASVSEILNLAALAAMQASADQREQSFKKPTALKKEIA